MIHVITVCHCEPATLAMSLAQALRTMGQVEIKTWILLDNVWPIEHDNAAQCIKSIARMVDGSVISVPKNLGGHGGFNFAFHQLNADLQDLILWYDPDSYPITQGWLKAMKDVMDVDGNIATLSLWPENIGGKDWNEFTIAGHKVRTYPHAEMFSITMWRASFIGKGGVAAEYRWYGQIEAPAFRKAQGLRMRNAYLADFKEKHCPLPHPESYSKWKQSHLNRTFNGNFDEWLRINLNPN
jgi:GT2 family glycosyltransferase